MSLSYLGDVAVPEPCPDHTFWACHFHAHQHREACHLRRALSPLTRGARTAPSELVTPSALLPGPLWDPGSWVLGYMMAQNGPDTDPRAAWATGSPFPRDQDPAWPRRARADRLGEAEAARLQGRRLQGARPLPPHAQAPLDCVPAAGEAGAGAARQRPKQLPWRPVHLLEGPVSVALGAARAVGRSVRGARAC